MGCQQATLPEAALGATSAGAEMCEADHQLYEALARSRGHWDADGFSGNLATL